ncbi:hypothetical protein [Bradyrhizobium sp. CCBAU 45389]|uniref:hypothetical protein n=1 Tax=Bradyrhizobium sp. CCBAU 45389 TaxID=858429 RepID=UPI0023050920|nr:hypothetical protein [Bradyrhizobium sp. CCBAU 45389]
MKVYRPLPADHEQLGQMRQLAREWLGLLTQPPPDTFLGRTTSEPFLAEPGDPREDDR